MGIAANLVGGLFRSTPANPDRFIRRWFRGGLEDVYTGKDVSHDTALTCSAWAGAVLLLSETMGALPAGIYRRGERGGRETREFQRRHPLSLILGERANPEMTAMEFRAILESHLLSDGNFYAQRIEDRGGRLVELWPLEPSRMVVHRENGRLRYTYLRLDGSQVLFTREDVFHDRLLSRDGIKGIAPLTLARQAIGIGLGVEEFAGRFFTNSAAIRGALETDNVLGAEAFERLKKDWAAIYSGQQNAHKVAILEQGLKFRPIAISPKDSQMIELRKFQVNEIARIVRIPPHLLQDLERSTNNNITEQGLEFVKYSLLHRCVRLEQAAASQLLTDSERAAGLYFRHSLKGLLRGDPQRQGEFYRLGLEGGWFSPNDVRELEDLDPIEDGDIYTQQVNRAPLSAIAKAGPPGQQQTEE